jgi:hypothetical protein
MKYIKHLLSLLCLLCGTAYGQKTLWNTPMAYLGQTPPGDTPRVFAPGLLAQKDTIDMDRISFSPDGKELIYAAQLHWGDPSKSEVRDFRFQDGKWTGPTVLMRKYYSPYFGLDGKTLYLCMNDRHDTMLNYIWQSNRTPDGGWSQPTIFLAQRYPIYMLYPTLSGKFYLASTVPNNDGDICVLRSNGHDTTAESLGPPINTAGGEWDFYVAPDESYIILSTKEGDVPDCKLQISFHKKDGGWTALVSLGPLINDGIAHRWAPYTSPDGKYLFYSRGETEKVCHIHWVRFDGLLQRLKASTPGL